MISVMAANSESDIMFELSKYKYEGSTHQNSALIIRDWILERNYIQAKISGVLIISGGFTGQMKIHL